jgi:predicted nucleic acid-binding protein
MEEYLIDTNVVSDFFSESFTPAGMTLVAEAIDSFPNISVITQIELLCWKTDAGTEQIIKNFIADCNVLEISPFVIEACVRLRRVKKIKTPDAIIAATALAHGFTIITNNEKDFFNIKGLKWINPYKL